MKKVLLVRIFLAICLALGAAGYAFSADAEVKLNSVDGSTGFIVQDKDAVTVFSADSAGNTIINGTATVAGSQFSVGGSTFVVAGGKVGIGTAAPAVALDVNGAVRVGNFTNAARPAATSANKGTFIFDTTLGRPYVSNGTVWKPLDSDFDGDGITDAIDTDDNNAADATAVEADTLLGKTFYAGGAAKTGTMPTQTLSAANDTVAAGYYTATTLSAVNANLAGGNIKTGITIFGKPGTFTSDATAVEADTLFGKTFYAGGAVKTGTMPTRTLSAADETVAAGYYAGTTLSAVDANLAAENIKAGLTIFGNTGTFTSDATAGEADTLLGKTFYAGGAAKTGTMPTQTLSAANDTVAAGYYADRTLSTVDKALTAVNIKSGVTIFGHAGAYTSVTGYHLPDTGQLTTFATTFEDDAIYSGAQPAYLYIVGNHVTDTNTGLMWMNDPAVAGLVPSTWTAAITACEDSTFDGYDDWRLPNIRELMSIVDFGHYDPAIDPVYFPATVSTYYWSSTSQVGISSRGFMVDFATGLVASNEKISSVYVRCVRGGT